MQIGKSKEIDIAKNLRTIEWLKAELLDGVALLFKSLLRASTETVGDILASIIMITYVLGKRLGLSFEAIDTKIKNKLNKQINEEHELEEWYGDLTNLLRYFESSKR
ncbi:MAG TPA: MazG-like family protein [Syntrophomonadaceae bacterium]|nr:MazG-like family protein [Syntrophomonadaceae bacterium]